MESAFLLNFGSNLTTMGLALGIYVCYKRCVHSRCAIHSSWLDFESDEIKEIKEKKSINVMKKAMMEFQRETNRDINKNEQQIRDGTQSLNNV